REAAAADPGRGDQFRRHPHGGPHRARHPRAASGSNEFYYRAPSFDDPRRRPHSRRGGRQGRRARQSRRTAGPPRRLLLNDAGLSAPPRLRSARLFGRKLALSAVSAAAESLQGFVEITKRTRFDPFLNHEKRTEQ